MKKRKVLTIASIIIVAITIIFLTAIIALVIYYKNYVNTEYDDKLFDSKVGFSSTALYANSNEKENEYIPVKLDVSTYEKSIYYKVDDISNYLVDGFIAVEDKEFYSHSGVNLRRTIMAAVNYITGKRNTFGASTITQQVVKNISGDNELSIKRKFMEILRSYNIEKKHTKAEIMEVYLNIVPMGNGISGVGAASEFYFGKAPKDLSVSEAATLIGITNAPSAYNPYSNYEKCLQKRNIILKVMLDEKIIDEAEYKKSIKENIPLIVQNKGYIDSWFVETVISDVCRDFAKEKQISESAARLIIMSGGYSIYTTVDMRIQSIMEEFFENENNFHTEINNGLDYSMIVINPKNGDILGIIGGVGKKEKNRILNQALVPHIPASTLKPLALYAPLIDQGEINWATVFDDIPVAFEKLGDEYKEYPKNSPPIYDGLITVKDALKKSKNTIAIKLCEMLGVKNVFNNLVSQYDFDTLVEKDVLANGNVLTDVAVSPMALGQLTRGISLRKMTEAYTAFSNSGKRSHSRSYICVKDLDGNVVLDNFIKTEQVFSETTAKIMNQLLSEVVKNGTAKSINLKDITSVAGKTGTSGNNYDKMFIGYTPKLTAGIWSGYNSNTEILGISPTHLNIWDKIMTKIYEDCYSEYVNESFDVDGLIYAPFCIDSGKEYSHNCVYDPRGNRMEYGYFSPEDMAYKETCDRHVIINYDTVNKGVVLNNEVTENIGKVSLVKNEDRSFPKEIYVTDAEFIYRDINLNQNLISDPNKPYFYSTLKDREYVGISNKKKQFNCLSTKEKNTD